MFHESSAFTALPPSITAIGGYLFKWADAPAQRTDAHGKPYLERFERGCFAESLVKGDQIATIGGNRVASKSEGSFRLRDDPTGLRWELIVADEVAELAKRIKGSRIIFSLSGQNSDRWEEPPAEIKKENPPAGEGSGDTAAIDGAGMEAGPADAIKIRTRRILRVSLIEVQFEIGDPING